MGGAWDIVRAGDTGTIVASNWISPQRDRGTSRRTGG